MRFTFSWLKKYLDTTAKLEEIAHALTMIGLEVEEIIDHSKMLQHFEIAEILSTEKHPSADKLKVCQVLTSDGVKQIVCGAPNARGELKVVLAKIGTTIPNGGFNIKEAEIRGVKSCGMMCSYDELGLSGDSSGIIEVNDNAKVGDTFVKYMGMDDPVIHINITPNRADALGVYGIARDLAAAGFGKLKPIEVPSIVENFNSNCNIVIKDKDSCPYFSIREIKNINNSKSPKWLSDLLENVGIGSISPVVDITNYISYTFGQPMHAYDADKLNGDLEISLLNSTTKFKALNHKEYELAEGDLVISDFNQVQCLAGVIGGSNSACDAQTKRIILESASFDAKRVLTSGRRHMIETDSRYRFERNVDRCFTKNALDIATNMIVEICGGEAAKYQHDGSDKCEVHNIILEDGFLESYTGISVDIMQTTDILNALGFKVSNIKLDEKRALSLEVPSWRHDVRIKEDIVEEVIRIYGYDKISEIPIPNANISRILPKEKRRASEFKRILANLGYDEVVSWSFINSKDAEIFSELQDDLFLLNPISSDLDYMRPSIIPGMIRIAEKNINRSINDLSLFEIGPIFMDSNSADVVTHVAGIRTGSYSNMNCFNKARNFDVFDVKGDIYELFSACGIALDKCQLLGKAPGYYHPTRSTSIALGKNILGYFGEIRQDVLVSLGVEQSMIAFEININSLPYGKSKLGMRSEFSVSNYQKLNRDFAFIVDRTIPVGDIINFIENIDKNLIKKVVLFDIFTGDSIPEDKKSVAFSVDIQDDTKTLINEEIISLSNRIISGVSDKFKGVLRDG